MVVPVANLPMHVFQAEQAAQMQIAQNAATAGHAGVAAERTSDRAVAQEGRQVAQMNESDGLRVDPEKAGAHSHTLAERRPPRPQTPAPPEAPAAPDPTGRGHVLDVSV
jgi:hypothetical protein